MANTVPGYVFTSGSDPITASKLNLLGSPTTTVGTNEIITAMIADESVTYAKMQDVTGGGFLGRISATSGSVQLVTLNDGNVPWPSVGIAIGGPSATEISVGRTAVTRFKLSYGEPSAKATIFVAGAGTTDMAYGNGDTDWVGGTFNYNVGNGTSTSVLAMSLSLSGLVATGTFGNSPTIGVGYATGAGGTITQSTNRTTSVTLNTVCGAVTTNNTSLAALAAATFSVLNSAVAATDTVVVSIKSGAVNEKTIVKVNNVNAGNFTICVYNADAVTAETGAIVINFAVIKAVTS
jgi:hypothetical protein